MKFKENVKILTDRGEFKVIKGITIPYRDKNINIELLAHISENIWTPDTVDVSEKTTGCRLFSITDITLKDLKPKDIIEATTKFIQGKGKKVFLQKIEEQLIQHPEIYNKV